MKRVLIESRLAGDRELHKRYARACILDCLRRGEAGFAGHALYDHAEILDDDDPLQRRMGMDAGFAWGAVAELVAVYTDLGISGGMREGIARAGRLSIPIEYRPLPEDLWSRVAPLERENAE